MVTREHMRKLLAARKQRLIAEGKCIDCKAVKQDRYRRCPECRLKAALRERNRHRNHIAEKKPIQVATVNPQHIRNAKELLAEIRYDDGLDPRLRQAIINAISKWRATITPASSSADSKPLPSKAAA